MGRITGLEDIREVPPKVRRMYMAVLQLLDEGADAASISVSSITERAGIGKGTAYEYFDTKDEIIACAIVYQMQSIFGCLEKALGQLGTFREQMDFLFEQAEKKDGEMQCILRFVHMTTDNSEFSRMVREKMDSEAFAPYMPTNILGKILRQGIERGEVRGDVPVDYLVCSIFAYMLTHMMLTMDAGVWEGAILIRSMMRQKALEELEGESSSE